MAKQAAIKLPDTFTGYSFLTPNIIGFLVFTSFPLLFSLYMSFCDWDILGSAKWTGLRNYISLFRSPYFWKYLSNTLFYMLNIPLGMALSLFLAILMDQKLRALVLYRTIYFMPVVSSLVACALVWRYLYNPDYGLVNMGLHGLGITNVPRWLDSAFWAKPAIMLMVIWKGAGYNMLIYLAGLQGIPGHLYEASEIDGAGSWQRFSNITFPLLMPTHFFIFIMSVIGGFQLFAEVVVMTPTGGPGQSTATLVYDIWRQTFQLGRMGRACSLAWILFAFILIVTVINWKLLAKKSEEYTIS